MSLLNVTGKNGHLPFLLYIFLLGINKFANLYGFLGENFID